MFKLKRVLVGAGSLGLVGFGTVAPAQAGPQCLPYVTDSGQIVVICRQEAATSNDDQRSRFPGGLVGAPPEADRTEQVVLLKAEAEKNPGIRRGSGR